MLADNSSVGVVRLEKGLRGTRAFLSYSGGESRQHAEQARAMMAPAALRLVLLPRYRAFRVSVPLSLVALRRAVRGRPASADAGLLTAQGLGFVLFGHVSVQ